MYIAKLIPPFMVNLFLDCEFTGLVQNTSLISLALYKDEDCYFYAEFTDYNKQLLNPWIESNVIPRLLYNGKNKFVSKENNILIIKEITAVIVENLKLWLADFEDVEIWGDVPVYDWMLFCELFGGALNLPGNIFYIPFDIATLGKTTLKVRDFSRFDFVEELIPLPEQKMQHNALSDAKVECLCYKKFMKIV